MGDDSILNDDFWGVMALVAAGLDPDASDAIQDSVSFILANQDEDGGWSWGGGQPSDVDDTAAAIMALIAAGHSPGSAPVADGLSYLKAAQMSNGGFESWGETNSATNSWAINSIAAADRTTATTWRARRQRPGR
jgi:prenyltransferase beta subunit